MAHFNPRSPHGERRGCACKNALRALFQSTLPARGATQRSINKMNEVTVISIHAPRTGSDPHGGSHANQPRIISIHAPRTGSDSVIWEEIEEAKISIHAPRTGSDRFRSSGVLTLMISIHAPRTGSDL